MRKLLSALVLTAACALPTIAMAGGSRGTDGALGANSEFQCTNQCPLAQKANTRRATGTEAEKTSVKVRADMAKKVVGNLERI